MDNWCICWLITHILLGILIFKGMSARCLYKSFVLKGYWQNYLGNQLNQNSPPQFSSVHKTAIREAMQVSSEINNARSHNHFCRGKAIFIHTLCACSCPSHPVCQSCIFCAALCCHLRPVLLYHTFAHYLVNNAITRWKI
jgi:hypothetical protein